MKKIKVLIKAILIIVIIIITCLLSLSYTITKNKDYQDDITNDIKNHYQITDEILYSNIYGNYYIFTTKNEVIVLNKEYEEVLKEKVNQLSKNKNNYNLIYKTKKLMYENTIIKNNKVTYEYYDAKTYKKLSSTTMEK